MYNQEIKGRYIQEKNSTTILPNGYLNNLFKKTEQFEQKYNKDVSTFTYYEIIEMYKTWNANSVEILIVANSQLSLYAQWCSTQSLVKDGQNHFLECVKNNLVGCVNTIMIKKKFLNKTQLIKIGEMIPNASDEFMLLALYEGICGKDYCELVNLKMSDFEENMVTLCTGRTIQVSSRLVDLAKLAYDTYEYFPVTSDPRSEKITLRRDDDKIIKDFPNSDDGVDDFQKGRRIYRRIRRNLDFIGMPWLSGKDIVESGRVEFIKTNAEKDQKNAIEYIFTEQCINKVEEQFGDVFSRIKQMKTVDRYKEYLV